MPNFPQFKSIELDDQAFIEKFTSQYSPYSDFNFISLLAWDTDQEREYSVLNDNLIVKFTDYTTNEPFLSLIGTEQIPKTVATLLDYCEKNELPGELRLVPEVTAKFLKEGYKKKEDEDNFDYLFSTDALQDYVGGKFKKKRHLAARFKDSYPTARVHSADITDARIQVQLFELLKAWSDEKISQGKDVDLINEQAAIIRSLKAAEKNKKLILSLLTLEETVVAFSIDEILHTGYAISHFFKTDHSHSGITEYFNKELAKLLTDRGVTVWNWEQDLGLSSLKKAKLGYRPIGYLKKYIVNKSKH